MFESTKHKAQSTKRRFCVLKKPRASSGFSLVELMVAVALFAVVMTISVGSLLSLVEANRKARALSSVMNNLNFALENMSRNIRLGTNYHCHTTDVVPPNLDATNNCASGGVLFAFEGVGGDSSTASDQVIYRFIEERIEKSSDGGASFVSITAPEVAIEDLTFYVVGATRSDSLQPRVVVKVRGRAGISGRAETSFNLQSTISQRVLDL